MLKHHHPQQSSIITKTAVSVATVFLAAIFLLIFGITYLNSYWMHHRILTDKQEFVNEISRSIDVSLKALQHRWYPLGTSLPCIGFLTAMIHMIPAGWLIYGRLKQAYPRFIFIMTMLLIL